MVRFVDVPLDSGDANKAVADINEAIKESAREPTATTQMPKAEARPVDDPRFAGKSAAEIVEMYRNLESHSGRLASQLGESRQALAQTILRKTENDLRQGSGREPVKIQPADLMVDPTTALDRYLEARNNPQVSALQERLNQLEAQLSQTQFSTRHPKADEVTADPAFAAWVRQTPLRMRLAQSAANGGTADADLLLTEWQVANSQGTNTVATSTNRAQELAKSVTLESSASGSEGTGRSTTRTFSRRDLIKLRQENPDKYESPALQAEIMKAYRENRVVD